MNFFSFDQLVLTFVGQSLYSTWVILESITEYFGWNEEKAHMNTWTQVENNWTGNKSSLALSCKYAMRRKTRNWLKKLLETTSGQKKRC